MRLKCFFFAQELRLTKFKKQFVSDLASLNLTRVNPNPNNSKDVNPIGSDLSSTPNSTHNPDYDSPNYTQQFCGGRGPHGGRNVRGQGCKLSNSNVQCQVCSKFGYS